MSNVNIISVGMFNSFKRANVFKPVGINLLHINTGLADKSHFYQTAIIYLAFVMCCLSHLVKQTGTRYIFNPMLVYRGVKRGD